MTSSVPFKSTLALTLAVSAIAAPDALARFDLNPPGVTQAQAQAADAGRVVQPNPDQRAIDGVPPILPVPDRSGRAAILRAQQQESLRLAYLAYNQPTSAKYSNADTNAYANDITTNRPRTVHVVSHDGRFDWGDAGIGAAGGLGLAMVGVGGAFAVSQQRRTRRSKGAAAITS
jgi:hypothetical protein